MLIYRISHIFASGLIQYWRKNIYSNAKSQSMAKNRKTNQEVHFNVIHMYGVFVVYFLCLSMSSICFVMEIIHFYYVHQFKSQRTIAKYITKLFQKLKKLPVVAKPQPSQTTDHRYKHTREPTTN